MRKLVCLFSLLSLWMAASVSAQSLKKQEATMEDYLPLLNATGYKVYTFDISEFKDDSYLIHFKVKEYTDSINGKEIGRPFTFPSRLMLDNFPKEQQERIISEGRAYDAEKGIYGPGHNSFTKDEEGKDVCVFHARTYEEILGDPLYDPNRHAMLMPVDWDEQDRPIFQFCKK